MLAGGLGTRLREETEFKPKPMVEVGGKPIVWHILKTYAHYGHKEFVICVGYKGSVIRDYFLNYQSMSSDFSLTLPTSQITFHGTDPADWTVTIADTGEETPTGGRIALAATYLQDERFMVTYGDGLADVDIHALLEFHEKHGRLATITAVRPPLRFGIMDIGHNDRVERFREKPLGGDWVNAGFFVFEPGVLDYLDPASVLEKEPLEKLARDDQLRAFKHDGFWQPMDTYREARLLNDLWDQGSPPWAVWRD